MTAIEFVQEELTKLEPEIRLLKSSDLDWVWQQAKELPALLPGLQPADERLFKGILLQRSTMAFIVDNGGLVYYTEVAPKDSAFIHGAAWDERVQRRPDLARKTMQFMFNILDLHRLSAVLSIENTLAAQYAESLGFTLEGTIREFMKHPGTDRRVHALYYGLLRKEFANGHEEESGRGEPGAGRQDRERRAGGDSRPQPADSPGRSGYWARLGRRWRAVSRAFSDPVS